ncbi:hypothetical protein pdam_00018171 [Pocillopora damicornis]|uniref:Sushi domain-containing protein n=1 Tax=Pocillopora damicornis TaxID=46731 RepID=A0A3M6UZB9_POCDA|nr:hypothetical protein pdam_00018171 [Pocillopora damicornis]
MGDEGTSTHVLVEHRKAENELEELQLTKSDKSKQRPSRTKAPNQEIKRKEPAKRIHVEKNQSLDVVKSFAESISANFTVLTESMTNSFQKLGENLNVMNDNIMSLVHWPESELYEDISEQLDVNEGRNRRMVISSDLDTPTGIALDPHEGLMFWNAWGNASKVEKSNLDGTQRFAIVTSHLTWPSDPMASRDGMATELMAERIFRGINYSLPIFESKNYVETFTIKILWQLTRLFVFIAGITCPGLPSPTNGTRLGCSGNATEFYDTVCQFKCNNGYIGSGSQIRRCQENKTWSGDEFVCQRITCPGLPSPTNGTKLGCSGNATEFYDIVCQFECNNGYIGSGSQIRRCQENKTWSGEEFVCQRITCPGLPSPTNGTRLECSGNATEFYDTVCQFECNNGYVGSGSQIRRCQENKTWSGEEFVCQIVMCPTPLPPANSFSCIEGYKLVGSSLRKCQDNGLWSGGGEFYCENAMAFVKECIERYSLCPGKRGPIRIICDSLQLPPNVRTNGSCNRLPGNGCHFTCERGFNLIGSEIMWCNNDGSWTGTQPRCDVVTCPMLSLPTNGVFLGCNTNTTEMLYGTECSFSCKEGSVATGSTRRRCTENGNWTGTDLECTGIRDLAKL